MARGMDVYVGKVRAWRMNLQECYQQWKDKPCQRARERQNEDWAHLIRRKTLIELVRASAAVAGIEFSYAAETAFVSPTLLKIGLPHRKMTLLWCLSPLIGLFLTPILGSLSDGCRSKWGRRRPFLLLLAVGVTLGLLLVPNGAYFGYLLGDPAMDTTGNITTYVSRPWGVFFTVFGAVLLDFDADACQSPARAYILDVTTEADHARGLSTFTIMAGLGGSLGYTLGGVDWDSTLLGYVLGGHVRAVFTLVTFIFVVCVWITLTSFREKPLTSPELASGHNGNTGYMHFSDDAAEDDSEVKASYGTMEIMRTNPDLPPLRTGPPRDDTRLCHNCGYVNISYDEDNEERNETSFSVEDKRNGTGEKPVPPKTLSLAQSEPHPDDETPSFLHYLHSIINMPGCLASLCLTNLFCWMSLVCYSLYFTDFVGEAVFGGDPQAAPESESRQKYEAGVRLGCWGMALYSLSCALYSSAIAKLIERFTARPVYIGGQLVYSIGMVGMSFIRHPVGVVLLSCTAGVMYSTLFTMPYMLVARYHTNNVMPPCEAWPLRLLNSNTSGTTQSRNRGLGTDIALVSSCVFLAQFLLSLAMGYLVTAIGSTVAVVASAAFLALMGALCATQIPYAGL